MNFAIRTFLSLGFIVIVFSTSSLANNSDPAIGISAKNWDFQALGFDSDETHSVLSFGLGLGRLSRRDYYRIAIPHVGISYDRPAFGNTIGVDWITAGGYVGFARYKWDYYGYLGLFGEEDITVTEITLASRWGVDVSRLLREEMDVDELPENIDFYAVIQAGYTIVTVENSFIGAVSSGFRSGISLGTRLNLNRIGIFAELGWTEAGFIKGGLALKI